MKIIDIISGDKNILGWQHANKILTTKNIGLLYETLA